MTRPLDLEALTVVSVRAGALRDQPVAVLGLARSGIALARFLADHGAAVIIHDRKPEDELRPAIAALEGRPVRLALGPHVDPAAVLADVALVAASPAVSAEFPTTEPALRAALADLVARRRSGDPGAPPIVSEIDLFLRLCVATTVGVTGTKGKTTTSSLIAAILATDPQHPVLLGGNIGRPLIEQVDQLTPDHRVVLELSELQLPTLSRGTTAAVYTNVTADHLDRHGTLEAYRQVKARLASLVPAGGLLVLNRDDPFVAGLVAPPGVTVSGYTSEGPLEPGVGVKDGRIVVDGQPLMAIAGIPLPGRHSLRNVLAAVAVGSWLGVDRAAMAAAVSAFPGVEHRLETVAVAEGIRYVNDSQGTQPDAVIAALWAFDPPIVLIAGGRDKDIDLAPLGPVVAERAAAAVLIGESGARLGDMFAAAGLARIVRASSMTDAVVQADAVARELADRGDGRATVLLSPAAASFDMFVDYEDRGRAFRAAVDAVLAERASKEGRP